MITVFGSLSADLVAQVKHLPTPGETVTGPSYTVVPGGKGANQALAAAVQREVQREIDDAEGQSLPMDSIERFAFYEEAKKAYAVVATTEGRAYGCFLLKKGVVFF